MINENHFIKFPVLETERLILRKFSLSDDEAVYLMRTNDKVMKHMDSERHVSVSASREFITKNFETMKNHDGLFWAITEKSSQKFIGDTAFWNIDKKNARAEIGYSLDAHHWGKGYMTEVMKVIFTFGFQELKIHSFEANINPDNKNSRKVLEKMGFQKEAYFRENYFFDGRFLDSEIYCLLEKDYSYLE